MQTLTFGRACDILETARTKTTAAAAAARGFPFGSPLEVGVLAVASDDDALRGVRPLDPEGRVVPAHPAVVAGRVDGRDLIEDFGVVFERLEAVGELARQVEHPAVVGRQFRADPLLEGRRVGAQVYAHVEDRAARAAHELALRVRGGLEVHPAQRALAAAEREVALDEAGRDAAGGEVRLRPDP